LIKNHGRIYMIRQDEHDAGDTPATQLIHPVYHAGEADHPYPAIFFLKKPVLSIGRHDL
jgi:hypothetical protein